VLSKFFGEKGFTLIEVLIGLIILAIGVLAIAGMQITSIRGTSFSNNLNQASILAQERLEFLKSLPISDTRLGTGYGTQNYPNDMNVGIFLGSYSATRNPNYVLIRYTVSWLEQGVTHHVSFSTIKSR
jgi:prepilin-type N-terminal cleavage/methylation domain-containing protein